MGCCETLESMRTYSILVWSVEGSSPKCHHHLRLKSPGVVTIIHVEFNSQACKTIHYALNETLKGFRCCDLPESVQPHSILVWKVDKGQANFDPILDSKTHCGHHFRAHIPISTFSNHSLDLQWEIGRDGMLWNSWINANLLHLGVKRRGLEP